ncbi:MAG: hypothetical protein QNI99_04955 [Woeseiaceae bacterium]|nr:hypothetical protein [Woeseiaceae bacterium]
MHELIRQPAGVVFLAFMIPTLFTFIDWRIAVLGWAVLQGWYLLIRWSLSETREYSRRPLYIVGALLSLLYVPMLGVFGLILGEPALERVTDRHETAFVLVLNLALAFVCYSAWTAAGSLVRSEEAGAADRAVRWERTLKTFLAMWFWPIGIWSVQKRVVAAVEFPERLT